MYIYIYIYIYIYTYPAVSTREVARALSRNARPCLVRSLALTAYYMLTIYIYIYREREREIAFLLRRVLFLRDVPQDQWY